MSIEQNKAATRRFVEAVIARDLSTVQELVTDDFILHLPGAPDMHGREGARQWAQMMMSVFPGQQVTIVASQPSCTGCADSGRCRERPR